MAKKQFRSILFFILLTLIIPGFSFAQSTIIPTPDFPQIFRNLESESNFLSILLITLASLSLLASPASQAIGSLILMFYKKPKGKWGEVYDSITKRKKTGVIVYLYKKNDQRFLLVEKQKTDKNGFFGFDVQNGEYKLDFYSKNYKFPSDSVAKKDNNKYAGEVIVITSENQNPNLKVPIDPLVNYKPSFDAKLSYYSKRIGTIFLIMGTFFALYSLYYFPTPLRLTIIIFPALIWILILLSILRKNSVLKIISEKNGVPLDRIPIDIIGLDNSYHKKYLTDLNGIVTLNAPQGKYQLSIKDSKNNIIKKINFIHQENKPLGQITVKI